MCHEVWFSSGQSCLGEGCVGGGGAPSDFAEASEVVLKMHVCRRLHMYLEWCQRFIVVVDVSKVESMVVSRWYWRLFKFNQRSSRCFQRCLKLFLRLYLRLRMYLKMRQRFIGGCGCI